MIQLDEAVLNRIAGGTARGCGYPREELIREATGANGTLVRLYGESWHDGTESALGGLEVIYRDGRFACQDGSVAALEGYFHGVLNHANRRS